jgi:threonine/homoserine/homoserine lactone efflux protein
VGGMSFELLIYGLIPFAFVSSITPGPNNMMLLASGANYGFRRTVPHMLGISLGHSFMVLALGFGLIRVFDAYPLIQTALTYVSVAYLLYLAFKIATAAPVEKGAAKGKPFTFLQAALFQWVNPKAWFMATYAITAFAADQTFWAVFVVSVIFAATNLPSICVWTVLGQQMTTWLSSPRRLAVFNWTMAALLVASLYPVVFGV